MSSEVTREIKVALVISALGGLLSGYNPAIMSPAGSFINDEFDVNDAIVQGFVTSIMLFGALFGSFAAGVLATRFGRRYAAVIGTGICILGGATPAFSINLGMFLALRFILGFGVGLVGVICPLYVNEIIPDSNKTKGKYGTIFQLSITLGILLSYVIGYLYSVEVTGVSLQWRLMLGSFGIIFPVLLLIVIILFMKETQDPLNQVNESTQLQNKNNNEQAVDARGGWKGLFVCPRFMKQTLTGIVLAMTLQLTGVNAIIYFGTTILQQAFPSNDPRLLNIVIGAWNFFATWISFVLVDKMKRRYLMTGSTIIIAVSLFIVGFCFQFIIDERGRGIGVAVGLFLFIGGFEAGPGCLFYILANEIFDKNVRAEGAGLVNVLQWLFNLMVSTLFPYMFSSALGEAGTFFVFACFGLFCAIYLFLFLKVPSDQPAPLQI